MFKTEGADTLAQYRILSLPAVRTSPMSSCPDCNQHVDHCHGTLVVHTDRTVDCTDTTCEFPDLLRHGFVVDCMAVLGGCCMAEEPAELAAAS